MIPGIVAAAGVQVAGGGGSGPPPVTAEAGNVVLYTGNETTRSITGAGLQPDLIFLRDRSGDSWRWVDVERGLTSWMNTATFTAEDFDTDGITAVGADGFDLGESTRFNADGVDYAAFCLKQIAGGFDIVTYSGGSTPIPHGLGVVPELIIIGDRYDTRNWLTYPGPLASPETKFLFINSTSAVATTTAWNSGTAPTDTDFSVTVGIANGNKAGDEYVAYLFASVTGKTKVGSYSGTGAAGNAITTGFRPKWVLIKCTSTTGDWLMIDEARDDTDPITASLALNSTAAESTSAVSVTFSDTGFEPTSPNTSGATYIYLAVA
jgi:hypothetical protein